MAIFTFCNNLSKESNEDDKHTLIKKSHGKLLGLEVTSSFVIGTVWKFVPKFFQFQFFINTHDMLTKVIGMPDFRGSAKGGVKKMELWKLIISKNFCYKAFLNTFIILKFFTAPENDAV